MLTFGVAIPSHAKHRHYIPELLDSLKNASSLPDCVSISCSSMTEGLNINESNYPFEIRTSISEKHKGPSENRNIAASKLSTDIISFIDSDDLSYYNRTEVLRKIMEDSKVVVHNFNMGLTFDNFIDTSEIEVIKDYIYSVDEEARDRHGVKIPFCVKKFEGFHCGHITMLKDFANSFPYNENESVVKWREDSELLHRIICAGYKIDRIKNKLSFYRK